jgi:hypothetical protein
MIALVVAVLVIFFLSLFVGAAYGEYLRKKKGENNTVVELGIRSGASSCCILMLIFVFFMWPATFAWYLQPPISIFYNLISKNLRPASKSGGLLPAQTYRTKAEKQTADTTYKYLHLLLTASVAAIIVGVVASAVAPQTSGLFFPGTGGGGGGGKKSKGPKQPRSPFTNRPY